MDAGPLKRERAPTGNGTGQPAKRARRPRRVDHWSPEPSTALDEALRHTRFTDLPHDVVACAQRLLLDLIGVAAAGSRTEVARITARHAAARMVAPGEPVRMLFDGRIASPAAAAFVGAATIDSFDAHDGHVLTKGHIGVTVLPTLLALHEMGRIRDGRDFLTAFVLGYEIGTRAGIVLHATAPDYHTSGAWGAVAAAALVGRQLRLSPEKLRHALGTAEFHGPRSQMMRCVMFPTMVKDGSGWGAFAGVTAALLAAEGYTGAPAVTVEDAPVAPYWSDLGSRWRILEQYVKAYPVCRWAQPAMEAARDLQRRRDFAPEDIKRIEVLSFHEAVSLVTREPLSTDEAQYSLPFPVAALLVHGRVGAREITGPGLRDPRVLALTRNMKLTESAEFSALFPAERWAQVKVTLHDGRRLASKPCIARGNPENPLSPDEMLQKYRELARPVLGRVKTAAIEEAAARLTDRKSDLAPLADLLLGPVRQ
jgi:2-methylcitrate dehydratase PrpD